MSGVAGGGPKGVRPWLAVGLCLLAACRPVTSPEEHAATRSPRAADGPGTPRSSPSPASRLPEIQAWHTIEDLPRPIAQMETVFWEPDDTVSLRRLIRETDLVRGKRVLEIGTGTGLIALCCLQAGAAHVVATDINPQALINAAHNAEAFGFTDRLELRRVDPGSPGAYSVLAAEERFDLILSNPPWEDQRPENVAEYALYDPGFELLKSLLAGLPTHLKPAGKGLFAYGCKTAISKLHGLASRQQLQVQVLDDRDLTSLPEVFLPGMLLELTVPEPMPPQAR